MKSFLIKLAFTFLVLSISYYLFILAPKQKLQQDLAQTKSLLVKHHAILLENRLAFVEITKLDPDSANFNLEKSSLVARLQETNRKGQEELENSAEFSKIHDNIPYQQLVTNTYEVYKEQNKLLERVFEH